MTSAAKLSVRPVLPLAGRTDRYGWFVCGVFFCAFAVSYLDRQIIAVLVGNLRARFEISDTGVSLIQGLAFSIFFIAASLPLGWLVDRINRRNLLIAAVLLWSVATIACGLAQTYWQLFAARAVVGVGEACLAPVCASMLADYFRPDQRGRANGLAAAGMAVGTAGSLFLGGFILQMLPHGATAPSFGVLEAWQLAFIAAGSVGILLAGLLFSIREPARTETLGALAGHVSLTSYMRKNGLFAFIALYASFALVFMGSYAVGSWSAALLMRVHGTSPAATATAIGLTVLICGPIAAALGGVLSDRMFRRFPGNGRFRILAVVCVADVICAIGLAVSDTVAGAIAAIAGLTFFPALAAAIQFQTVCDLVPNELRGRAIAVALIVQNVLGMALGPTMVALITDQVFRDDLMLGASIAVVATPTAILALILILVGLPHYRRVRQAAEADLSAADLRARSAK